MNFTEAEMAVAIQRITDIVMKEGLTLLLGLNGELFLLTSVLYGRALFGAEGASNYRFLTCWKGNFYRNVRRWIYTSGFRA